MREQLPGAMLEPERPALPLWRRLAAVLLIIVSVPLWWAVSRSEGAVHGVLLSIDAVLWASVFLLLRPEGWSVISKASFPASKVKAPPQADDEPRSPGSRTPRP
jgi:hypothetical protein